MALAGDHVVVTVDDAGGTPRTFAAGDIQSVDLGFTLDQWDVTGFGDAVHRFINGQVQAPVTIKGFVTTGAAGTHTVFQGALAAGTQVSLEVKVGQNAAPTTGDPKYTGEFYVASYVPTIANNNAIMFTATLNPAVGSGVSVPAWGTIA